MIEFPAILFSSESVTAPFVDALGGEEELRVQYLRRHRSGALRSFLVVDRRGSRVEGETLEVEGLAPQRLFRFGFGTGVVGMVASLLTLDPPVSLKLRLEPAGSEPLETTRERIYHYLTLNPAHYTWAGAETLRRRVARARSMEELVKLFSED